MIISKIKNTNKIFLIVMIALFLEVIVFNYKFFTTIFNSETVISQSDYGFGEGLIKKESENMNEVRVQLSSDGEKSLEFLNINSEVDNIYLDIENTDENRLLTNYTIAATDEGNSLYYNLNSRDVVYSVEKTKYISLDLLGKSEKLKLIFNESDNQNFIIKKIVINAHYPMFFSIWRVVVVFLIILAGYIVRPKSPYYKYVLNLKSVNQRRIVLLLAILNIIVLYCVAYWNPVYREPPWYHHSQYSRIAESFLEGKVYLDDEPDESLKNMDNPYDTDLRNKLSKEEGLQALWDTAYYDGKYYVYFGVTPVVAFYLPYKALTGNDFPTWVGIFICAAISVFAVLGFINQVIKRWFKDVPFIIYLILSFIFINGCGTINMVRTNMFYSLPRMMCIMLAISGLYFWLSSIKKNKISTGRVFMGSLCIALISGCRPQVLLVALFAIPIFWDTFFKKKLLFSKKGKNATICFCIPFVIIGVFMMYYNYIRFDSIFEFGAKYNITTNDMTRRGIKISRIPLGIFTYLFQPLNIGAKFPFVNAVNFQTNYMGRTIAGGLFGGIFFQHIILFVNFLVFRYSEKLKEKKLLLFIVMNIAFGTIISIIDTQVSGIVGSYTADFSFMFFISAVIIFLTMWENSKDKHYIICFSVIALVWSAFYNFANLFFNGDVSLLSANPTVYYTLSYLVQFWL